MFYNTNYYLRSATESRNASNKPIDVMHKNSSLQFYCVRAKNSLTNYIQSNNSPEFSQESYECLLNINRQLDLNSSDIESTQKNVLLLLEHDIYYILARLGILKIQRRLFDQQILLFKRLVRCLLITPNEHTKLPLVCGLGNTIILTKISQCLGIYLVDYTNYDELNIHHMHFIISFIPTVLEVYTKFPCMLEKWLQQLCHDTIAIETLAAKNHSSTESVLDSWKYLPLYDLIFSLLFTENCQDKIIEGYFMNLIKLLSNDDYPLLKKWLQQLSDISNCFNDKFFMAFDQAYLKDGVDKLHEYEHYLNTYINMLNCLTPEFQGHCIVSFKSDFFDKVIFKYQEGNSDISVKFVVKTIECMLPKASTFLLKEFLCDLFHEDIFAKMIYQCFTRDKSVELEISLLKLFNEILESKCDDLINDLYCVQEETDYDNEVINSDEELRIKAMKISSFRIDGAEQNSGQDFFQILQKFKTTDFTAAKLMYDNNKMIPRIISKKLLSFFQNSYESNELLVQIVNNLLSCGNAKIYNVCSNDIYPDCNMKHIYEFLIEAFFNYNDMINEYNERKYQTMNSAKTLKTYDYEYLRPTTELLKKISLPDFEIEKSLVDHESLILNINYFQEFFSQLYYSHLVRHIIYRNVNS